MGEILSYFIRPFHSDDAPALASLTLAAIKAVGSVRYSAEQTAAWAARHPGAQRFLDRSKAGDLIWVAADEYGIAAAYALLETDGHLDMLYCHPDHTRRGLADALLSAAAAHAIEAGLTRLFTEASELARPAFERAGYRVQKRRDFTIPFEGRDVAIHNYAMEKLLS